MNKADSTQRFTDRVEAYVAARPSYPLEIATLLARELALSERACVADLGCGTGLSCLPFLRAGWRVLGVEPNDAMRAAGEKFLAGQGEFRAVAGTAEATTLADASVDLVVAAQAAHWFDLPKAHAEALRIVRRPPRAAVIWNDRVTTGSPFAEGYEAMMREIGAEYTQVRHRDDPAPTLLPFFGHDAYREAKFAHATQLDFAMLLARVNSVSYVPKPETPAYAPMVERVRRLFESTARDGKVTMEYVARVFFGELAS